jgi:hypothetical protein
MTENKDTSNLINFPKTYKQPPITIIAEPAEDDPDQTHHEEIFEYDDGSYVILVLPNDSEFTLERMVFMAERLKRTMFDEASRSCPHCLSETDDEDVATVDDPTPA